MKTIKLFAIALLGAVSLLACKNDDDFYNAVYLEVPDLITIDTPASYNVGDNVAFHADFSRYLPEAGQSDLLDIYRTSGATSFGFGYRLEKETAPDVWTSVLLGEDEYSIETATYQSGTMSYTSDEAITLTSAGEYRLSFSQSYLGIASTDLISNNPEEKTAVIISTTANDTDAEGYYYFTVN